MDRPARKIEINNALADEAQQLGIDLSSASLAGIERAIALKRTALMTETQCAAEAEAWARENADALTAYRVRIARDGVFGEDFRTW